MLMGLGLLLLLDCLTECLEFRGKGSNNSNNAELQYTKQVTTKKYRLRSTVAINLAKFLPVCVLGL